MNHNFKETNIYEPRYQENKYQHIECQQTNRFTNELLNILPFKTKDLKEFFISINCKVGILFIYESKDIDRIYQILENQIYSDSEIMTIMEHQFTTYCLEYGSKEASPVKI